MLIRISPRDCPQNPQYPNPAIDSAGKHGLGNFIFLCRVNDLIPYIPKLEDSGRGSGLQDVC